MIEFDRKIGHNSVMSSCELFIDRYELPHLLDQFIHDIEGIVDTSAERSNRIGQFFAEDFLVDVSAAL